MELIKLPNEDYKRSKGHLQTDVLRLERSMDGYRLLLYRDNSKAYTNHLDIFLDEQVKKSITYRILDNLKTTLY